MKNRAKSPVGQEQKRYNGLKFVPYSNKKLAKDPRADILAKMRWLNASKEKKEVSIVRQDIEAALQIHKSQACKILSGLNREGINEFTSEHGFYHFNPAALALAPSQCELYAYLCQQCNHFANATKSFKIRDLANLFGHYWSTIKRELDVLVKASLISVIRRNHLYIVTILAAIKAVILPPAPVVKIGEKKPAKSSNKVEPKAAAGPPKEEPFFETQTEEERESILDGLAKAISAM